VQFFTAEVTGSDVALSWVLPRVVSDTRVRVVRSHLGYPADLYDGAVVYEGQGEAYLDQGALVVHDALYYTAFVIAADGSVSSGAILKVRKAVSGTGGQVATTTASTTPPILLEEILLPAEIFTATEIKITQGNKSFNFKDTAITLNSAEAFALSIPYETLPKHLKTIIVTLSDPTDSSRTYAFLLRINKDRTAYEATIAPLATSGTSQFQVEIFEYEQRVMARYLAPVTFVAPAVVSEEVLFPDKLVEVIKPFFSTLTLVLLLIVLVIILIYKRLAGAEDNH
jgi:hypothetical protein